MIEDYDLPKYMRRHSQYLIMFGYITAIKKHIPSVSVDDCIRHFCKTFGMPLDGDVSTYKRMYERMNIDLIDSQKSK